MSAQPAFLSLHSSLMRPSRASVVRSLLVLLLLIAPSTMSQPARPPQLDHTSTVYLAVTHDPARLPHASSASPGSDAGAGSALPVHVELTTPSARSVDVSLAHAGQVGALKDVQLYGLPRAEWEGLGEEGRKEVVESVRGLEGVKSVEVQVLRQRTKRDEF